MANAALPDDKNLPPVTSKLSNGQPVARNIRIKFGGPEKDVALRGVREAAPVVTMPEAAVNEHNDTVAFQHNVRSARKAPIVKSEPVAESVED